jgi:hypothetical protein
MGLGGQRGRGCTRLPWNLAVRQYNFSIAAESQHAVQQAITAMLLTPQPPTQRHQPAPTGQLQGGGVAWSSCKCAPHPCRPPPVCARSDLTSYLAVLIIGTSESEPRPRPRTAWSMGHPYASNNKKMYVRLRRLPLRCTQYPTAYVLLCTYRALMAPPRDFTGRAHLCRGFSLDPILLPIYSVGTC